MASRSRSDGAGKAGAIALLTSACLCASSGLAADGATDEAADQAAADGTGGRRCEPPPAASPLEVPAETGGGQPARAGPGLSLVVDSRASLELACAPPPVAGLVLRRLVSRALAELSLDPRIAIVVSTVPIGCDSIYYVPVANDVAGIGYGHLDGRELFDDSPDAALEGIAFLNDWPYWWERPEELDGALRHEVGHRWGARVHARVDGESSTLLLGREQSHWSYFLETAGSPEEGNAWERVAEGRYRTTTARPSLFSSLDLYLMGAFEPSEVEPLRLLDPVAGESVDCRGDALSPASPPQLCESLELVATPREILLDDVIAAEGPRQPPATSDVQSIEVAVIVLHPEDEPLDVAGCEALSAEFPSHLAEFELATRGRLRLESVHGTGLDCSGLALGLPDLGEAQALSGGSCAMARRSASRPGSAPRAGGLWLAALSGLSLWRVRRRRRCA